jgi:hypothetical protein
MSKGARPNSPPHGSDAGANPVTVEHTPTSSLHEVREACGGHSFVSKNPKSCGGSPLLLFVQVSKAQSDAKRRLIGLSLMAASAFMFSVMSLSVHVC